MQERNSREDTKNKAGHFSELSGRVTIGKVELEMGAWAKSKMP